MVSRALHAPSLPPLHVFNDHLFALCQIICHEVVPFALVAYNIFILDFLLKNNNTFVMQAL